MKILDSFISATLPLVPKAIVKKISAKYIAGESLSEAVTCIKALNKKGIEATIDVLGEFITKTSEATHNADEYIDVINAIAHHKLVANISIKPTAMGLLLDEEFCYQTMKRLVAEANKYNIFVRIDMEDVKCTDKEFLLLERLRQDYKNVGIVVQAYLKRTYQDIESLIEKQISMRLCKGIYIEEESHLIENANNDRNAINSHFLTHLDKILSKKTYIGIATHDDKVIQGALDLIKKNNASKSDYEFQMLLGVREELRDSVIAEGHKMRVYVPFGKDWYGYSTRRIKENPSIAGYVFKAVVFGD